MRDLDRPRQSEELKRVRGHVADDVRGHCCAIRSVSRLLLRRTLAVIGHTRLLGLPKLPSPSPSAVPD